jgi:hypothetical protein
MKRWAKLGLIVAIPAALIVTLWASTILHVNHGERYFREIHAPGQPYRKPLSDYEWAKRFGGHAGLQRLEALSIDPSLTPDERMLAKRTASYIRDGRYTREINTLESRITVFENPSFRAELWLLHLGDSLFSVLHLDPQ